LNARAANERIAEKAERLQFVSRVPMVCECRAPDCRTIVMITLADYHEMRRDPERFLTAPGHEVEGAELEMETAEYAIRRSGRSDGANGDRRSA
jgi:hypothetical protein